MLFRLKQFILKIIISDDIITIFSKLYHGREYKDKLTEYYKSEIRLLRILLFTGVLVVIICFIKDMRSIEIPEGLIIRNTYGAGKKTVTLNVLRETDGNISPVTFDIDAIKYDDKTVGELSARLNEIIGDYILYNNESKDYVTKDLLFKKNIEDYPFELSYETSNPVIISNDGKINYEKLSEQDPMNEGVLVRILITAKYDDFEDNYELFVNIFNPEKSFEEKYEDALMEEIKTGNEVTKTKEYIKLPDEIKGIKVKFTNKNPHNALIIAFIFTISFPIVHMAVRSEVKKKLDARNRQMLTDYPKLLNKFALYFNAGMPVKAIWIKICEEYIAEVKDSGNVRYVFEEMVISNNRMKEGVSELEAYEDFSKRCGLNVYRNFVNQIEQAVLKGKTDMGEILKVEAMNAFNTRKTNARKLSEEASTKLLIPMFLMLIVVIVMVIFPAFYSMKI